MDDALPNLHALHLKKLRDFFKDCFPEFTLIMDGTPVFAEAECVKIRLVHKKTKRIHEFVVHLALYAKSLSGEQIAQHILNTIQGVKEEQDADGHVTVQVCWGVVF